MLILYLYFVQSSVLLSLCFRIKAKLCSDQQKSRPDLAILSVSDCSFVEQNELAAQFKKSNVIFWEETSMNNRYTIEAVEKSLQNLMES